MNFSENGPHHSIHKPHMHAHIHALWLHIFVLSNTRCVIVEAQISSDYLGNSSMSPGPRAVYDLQESERGIERQMKMKKTV